MATETETCTSDGDLRHRPPIRSDANSKLGADLLLEILIRLPNPRSACRCKLVCRLWRSVISDASFNRRYVSHHQTTSPSDLKSMILGFLPPMAKGARDALKVLDCNRGLVLCGFWDELIYTDDDGERSRSYLLCNPFTKQWAALPLAPKKSVIYSAPVARLVFEPQTSPPAAAAAHRFRVVYLYHQVEPILSIKLDVFCSESGEWIKDAVVHDYDVRSKGGLASWNGELFWVYRHYLSPDFGIRPLVAVFDPFRLDVPPTLDNMYKENFSFLLNSSSSSDPTNPDDAAAFAPAKVRRIKKRRVDAAFAPAKGLTNSNVKVRRRVNKKRRAVAAFAPAKSVLPSDSNSKVRRRRVTRRVASGAEATSFGFKTPVIVKQQLPPSVSSMIATWPKPDVQEDRPDTRDSTDDNI
ncbi:unnamed protein product [Linum trigynum]|uniref:F-box domain-containing protein n=1 Tax=Linum trigynum TaxID=586398 RepID=A0AAV2E2G7_9ROSI